MPPWHSRRTGGGRDDQPVLRPALAPADAAGAGYGRGDPGRAAAGEDHATGAAGVSAGVTGSENISNGREHVTVSAGEVQVIHDR